MENKKMLIDASNKEEVRVVVMNDQNLESYDFEVNSKEEVKGNIYLAKVTRVEASLQAAFVEYGRNRQGFLPFNEINIDYFNIPEDKKNQLKKQDAEYRAQKNSRKIDQEDAVNGENLSTNAKNDNTVDKVLSASDSQKPQESDGKKENNASPSIAKLSEDDMNNYYDSLITQNNPNEYFVDLTSVSSSTTSLSEDGTIKTSTTNTVETIAVSNEESTNLNLTDKKIESYSKEDSGYGARFGYKIQDVINKNDLILVQVVKDERGNKGASLTTYLSIPGRYCVLMPNSYSTDGGISKKISNISERNRLKGILNGLTMPENSSIIIRTAGVDKTEKEITQDHSYITNLWDNIQNQAKQSTTPTLIYEEGDLIKKIIRDSLSSEISEIFINNKEKYDSLVSFAKLIAPDIEKKIKYYKNKQEHMFHHFNIEEQIRTIYSPVVFLKSGGYLVIHPTEALTAIDVNSGKFKGNRNVEETALKNNLEAAAEVAKQLRLRNIGGLVVIDFIDMENPRNRAIVEKKLKEEVKNDSAKIQCGQISSFGLLEMARQHVKSSLFEKSYIPCAKCQGMGYVKPFDLNALQVLRSLSIDLMRGNYGNGKQILVKIPSKEAFYILNNKRDVLYKLEQSLNISILIEQNNNVLYPFYYISEANEQKDEPTTVLLLEKEIEANQQSSKKAFNKNKQSDKKHSNNRSQNFKNNKKSYNKSRSNNKDSHNRNKKPVKKEGWFKKLFKI